MASSWSRINTVLLLVILAGGMLIFASRARGGPLDPPAPPAATLPQVEPRIPVPPVDWNGTDPVTISQPGSYFLTRNMSLTTGSAIVIDANDVTLDLNGFEVIGAAANPSAGITSTGAVRTGVVIRNGHVRGFAAGMNVSSLARSTLEDLEVEGAASVGVDVGSGGTIKNLNVHDNGDVGIHVVQQGDNYGTLVTDSNASRNGFGSQINSGGIVINANNVWVRDSIFDANAVAGVRIGIGASYNQITDNRITGNGVTGVLITGVGTTYYNMVARNVIVFNGGTVTDNGTNSRIGAFVGGDASITATNPWSNVVY